MIFIKESITGSEPLSTTDAKSWMRVLYSDEDTLIGSLITQARDVIEKYLNLSMIDKTITLTLTDRDSIQLPYGPVQVITSVKDKDGDDLDYEVLNEKITFNSIVEYAIIVYDVGFVTVPNGLIIGLQQVVMRYFENRGESGNLPLITEDITTLKAFRRKTWI